MSSSQEPIAPHSPGAVKANSDRVRRGGSSADSHPEVADRSGLPARLRGDLERASAANGDEVRR